jgi:flagellar basal-body rod protein FlgB
MNAVPQFDPLAFGEHAMKLRAYRHEILGSNLTNADTPGYKARDIDFSAALKHELLQQNHADTMPMTTTSNGHYQFNSSIQNRPTLLYRVPNQPSMDGNTVDPDVELSEFTKNALMTQASITFLTGTIKSRLSAITGQPS